MHNPQRPDEALLEDEATWSVARSARACLRIIKSCTKSSCVICRARVHNRFLQRSAFLNSLLNCCFVFFRSACLCFNAWMERLKASCGNAELIACVAAAKSAQRRAGTAALAMEAPAADNAGSLAPPAVAAETTSWRPAASAEPGGFSPAPCWAMMRSLDAGRHSRLLVSLHHAQPLSIAENPNAPATSCAAIHAMGSRGRQAETR